MFMDITSNKPSDMGIALSACGEYAYVELYRAGDIGELTWWSTDREYTQAYGTDVHVRTVAFPIEDTMFGELGVGDGYVLGNRNSHAPVDVSTYTYGISNTCALGNVLAHVNVSISKHYLLNNTI